MKKIISTTEAPAAIGPYSQAVEAGGFLFLSGQIPLHPGTGVIVSDDVREQTKQVLHNIKAVLTVKGLAMAEVVKVTVFLTDLNDFAVVNEVYGEEFSSEPPARSCVQVVRLPKEAKVEIEIIALIKD